MLYDCDEEDAGPGKEAGAPERLPDGVKLEVFLLAGDATLIGLQMLPPLAAAHPKVSVTDGPQGKHTTACERAELE